MGALKIGQIGEQAALNYMVKMGYQVIHKNWRYRRLEVDLICKIGHMLVFVEVKCRSSNKYGHPEVFVDSAKQKHLLHAADAYCYTTDYTSEIRFDIISVILDGKQSIKDIRHFPDAFYEIG